MSVFCEQGDGYDLDLDSDDDDGIRIDGAESSDDDNEFSGDVSLRELRQKAWEDDNVGNHGDGNHGDGNHGDGNHGDEGKTDDDFNDDFERELNAELEESVTELEQRRFQSINTSPPGIASQSSEPDIENKSENAAEGETSEFYDDDYYDSDDETDGAAGTSEGHKRHPIISNDELLYDPNIDDDNQRWMDAQRASGRPKNPGNPGNPGNLGNPGNPGNLGNPGKPGSTRKQRKAASSDALLDCPSCLTTVCIDCQRHEIYPDQFRAMFVQNCTLDHTQMITAPLQADKRKRKLGRTPDSVTSSVGDGDNFQSVKCSECGTVIGCMDRDEVYHFFNVVPSHS